MLLVTKNSDNFRKYKIFIYLLKMIKEPESEALDPERLIARLSDLLKTFSRPPRSHARRDNTKRQLIEQAREPLRAIIRKHGLRLADLAALLAQCGLPVH